jgi:hypothetical protein
MTHFIDPVIAATGTIVTASGMYLVAMTPETAMGWEKAGIVAILIAGISITAWLYITERKRADDAVRQMALFKDENTSGLKDIKAAIEAQTKVVEKQAETWDNVIMPVVKKALEK